MLGILKGHHSFIVIAQRSGLVKGLARETKAGCRGTSSDRCQSSPLCRGGHLGANEPTLALKRFFLALKRLLSIFKS